MRLFAIVTALAVLLPAMRASADERRDEHLPMRMRAIEALPDGGALVLGSDSAVLIAIDAGGLVREVPHPDVGPLLELAAPWILGRDGILHREADGTWRRLAFDATAFSEHGVTLDPLRPGHLAVLAPDRLVVIRMFGSAAGGVAVDIIDGDGTRVSTASFPEAVFDRPIADGTGGFWVTVNHRSAGPAADSLMGYAQFHDDVWTLWQSPAKSSAPVAQLGVMALRDAADETGHLARLDDLVADGQGGAIGHYYGMLVRIGSDGMLTTLAALSVGHICAIAAHSSGLAVAWTGELDHLSLSVVNAAGIRVSDFEVPLPQWYTSAHFKPALFECSVAVAGDDTWLASGPFVFHHSPAGITTLTAASAVRQTLHDDEQLHPPLAPLVIPPLAIAGGGVFGAAAFHDRSYGSATLQVLFGTALALPGTLFLDVLDSNPCVEGRDHDYQAYNDVACAVRAGGYLVGIVGTGALGGLGAYTADKPFHGSTDHKHAFIGAWTGGMVGSAASLAATKLLRRYVPNAGSTARAILAATLVGTGATLGYQLGQ